MVRAVRKHRRHRRRAAPAVHRRLGARSPAGPAPAVRRPAGADRRRRAPATAPPASSSTSTRRTRGSASKPTPPLPRAPACRSAHTCCASPASSDRTLSCESPFPPPCSCSDRSRRRRRPAARAAPPPADPPGGLADKSLEDLMSVEVDTVFGAAKREQRVTGSPCTAPTSAGRRASRRVPTAPTIDDPFNETTDSRARVDATVTGAFHGAALTARAFGDYTGYRGAYRYLDGLVDDFDTADGVRLGAEGTASRRLGSRHQLSTGIEYRRNARQDQSNDNVRSLRQQRRCALPVQPVRDVRAGRNPAPSPADRDRRRPQRLVEPDRWDRHAPRRARLPHRRRHGHQGAFSAEATVPRPYETTTIRIRSAGRCVPSVCGRRRSSTSRRGAQRPERRHARRRPSPRCPMHRGEVETLPRRRERARRRSRGSSRVRSSASAGSTC